MNTKTIAFCAALASATALLHPASAGEGRVAFDYLVPPPVMTGTPVPINVPNLERVQANPQPLLVPEGTVLLSRDKPVTSSDDFPIIGELEQVTDGDKQGVDGSFVELGPGTQWVQIDLEAPHTLHAVVLWHYHGQERVCHDVVVLVSDDPDFTEVTQVLFNNDHDNTSGLGVGKDLSYIETNRGKVVDAKGVRARYVRLYSNGNTANDMNHYVEVEVYGQSAD